MTTFPHIGSYIGVPITLPDGTFFGTLCAVSPEPRTLAPHQADLLVVSARLLATQVERERAEEAQARLAAIVQSSDDAIIGKTLDGTIVSWNPGAQRLYGYSADEVVGKPISILVPPDRPDEVLEILARIERGLHVDHFETVWVTKDGRRIDVSLTVSPVKDSTGRVIGASAIARDITERRRLDSKREALLIAEQEQSKRLRELAALKADFTRMVAHELSSPIAVIRGYAALLARGDLAPAEQAQAVTAIGAEAEALTALVADMQASANDERDDFAVQPAPISVDSLMAEATRFAETLPGDHPISTKIATDGRVRADPGRIGQVLRNLLSNAAKYSPPGAPIELRAMRNAGRIRIEVADYGYGIDPEDVTRIFEKFGRGRDRSGRGVAGLGLGLYLSRRIVRAHGSDLTVTCVPENGSVFGFELEVVE